MHLTMIHTDVLLAKNVKHLNFAAHLVTDRKKQMGIESIRASFLRDSLAFAGKSCGMHL